MRGIAAVVTDCVKLSPNRGIHQVQALARRSWLENLAIALALCDMSAQTRLRAWSRWPESTLRRRHLVSSGDRIVVVGGVPAARTRGTNFVKIHTVR